MKGSRSLVTASLLAVLGTSPTVLAQLRPGGPVIRTPNARPLGLPASGTAGGATSAAPFPTAVPPPPSQTSPFKPSDGSDGAGAKPTDKTATASEAALPPRPVNGGVTIGLQEADLGELVNWIGGLTGKRFIYGAKVRSIKVTLYSPTPVTVAEAYKAFLVALETNGLTVIPHGRFLKIVETTGGVVTHTTPVYNTAQPVPAEDRYITRLYRLQHVGAEEVNTLLTKFKTKEGDISVYAPGNLLILTDTGTNIQRMLHIVEEIDLGTAGDQIWIEQVNYGTASDLVQRLNDIFDIKAGAAAAPGKSGAPGPSDTRVTKIIADDRSNSLIIVATEHAYLKILEVIKRLDAPITGEGEIHVLALQHAMAEELAPVLNQIIGGAGARPATGGAGGARPAAGAAGAAGALPSGILEGGVRIVADKATNSIVITASLRDYAQIRTVIDKLDMPRRQVFIEAVIMDMTVDHTTKLGLNYHAGAAPDLGGSSNSLVYGGFNPLNSIALPDPTNLQGLALGVRGPGLDGSTNLLGTGLTVPAFGVVMSALASSADANVLSTPHIIATDNVVAEINVGQNIPLQTNGGAGLASLAGLAGGAAGALGSLGGLTGGFGAAPRQDVGTKIKVTPHMNDSNEVRLELQEEISEQGATAGTLGAVSITKRTANTSVVVQDQQTVVIGGLMRDATNSTKTKVPILGDIPVIGFLFRSSTHEKSKTNLLLVLTPYVIRDQNDLRTVFERKMQERQEFLDRYFVFSDQVAYEPPRDYSRLNGLLEEIRQSYIDVDEKRRLAESTKPRERKIHEPGAALSMPEIIRPAGSAGGAAGGAGASSDTPAGTSPAHTGGGEPAPVRIPGRANGPTILSPGSHTAPTPAPGSAPAPAPPVGGGATVPAPAPVAPN